MYNGYISVGLLVQGLTAAGPSPPHAAPISALSDIHSFTALGLYGDRHLDINDRQSIAGGVDNCIWVIKLGGSAFQLVSGGDPICGTVIPGVTVAPSS
jgi:hypothetical protein